MFLNGRKLLAVVLTFVVTWGVTHALSDETAINTDGWSDSPYMTPDGQHLYFAYTPYNFMPLLLTGAIPDRRGPDRAGHHTNPNPWFDTDIYRAERQPDGRWGVPVNLPFNDTGADAAPLMLDNGVAYWQKDFGTADIVTARQDAGGDWSETIVFPAPINTEDYDELNPHVMPDEHTLYFTSDRPGGFGGLDLYVSYRAEDAWTAPENLGSLINTPDDEDQLWVDDVGQTLYFNRGLTIYRARRQGDAWSAPVPVEFAGGTVYAAEASLTADGQRMMLAVPDVEAERLWIMESTLQPDGRWSPPQPID